MTFYCNGKKAFCTESECNDTCDYYNGEGGEYQHDLVKLKTNADRIRAMNDEELAKWITYACDADLEMFCSNPKRTRPCDNNCDLCAIDWLKQPAEEDT